MRHINGDKLLTLIICVGIIAELRAALEAGAIGNLAADCGDAAPGGRPAFLEPGTAAAQDCGCTCPPQTAAPWKGYRRALDCPLHSPIRDL